MEIEHLLMQFGLTHQEARLYLQLQAASTATGYEIAKSTGISRANTYAGLHSLVEKGGAWLLDGRPAAYRAAPVDEFCGNIIRRLSETRARLALLIPAQVRESDGYITIHGERNIVDKIHTMIEETQTHIYLSMRAAALTPYLSSLGTLAARNVKIVLLTDAHEMPAGMLCHYNRTPPDAIRIISDTNAALTGSIADGSCLYSKNNNLVSLLRDSMANEIKLIQMEETDP